MNKKDKPLINKIPDYDYLFNEDEISDHSKKRKSKLFGKIIRLNIFPVIFSLLLL
jgi:hypothetical protein